MCFQIGDLKASRRRHFRTLLGLPRDVSPQCFSNRMYLLFLLPGGTLNQRQFEKLLRGSWDVPQKLFQMQRTVVILVFW